eukprot:TRINITY_DN11302_c0_g1_i2.p1 TRINITY_DN11302_c0_g1~~TRINITY_DN11302_c0_g1_i2.p1  ORF type:complete len:539 (-),score=-63.55 TRINITY_DN11302_c0_g1_i2:108-1724(-)
MNTKLKKDIKFSIATPLYNTKKTHLIEMIDSVRNQIYTNWQLCLYDGSDSEHSYVEDICKEFEKNDSRIKYLKTDEGNLGISGNTNKCLDMADGEYISLLDHDDLLHPSALYEVSLAIENTGCDFIYTDEYVFKDKVTGGLGHHFKPDFSPDTLRTNNYICHLTTFKKELQQKVGKFTNECDGSQDYDMILRLTEKANKIYHIPKALYYWRNHEESVASDISVKPYCIEAAKKALRAHLKRVGLEGEVYDSKAPTTYKIKYKIYGNPKVSIIIPNKDAVGDLHVCLTSIIEKSTYQNYEIIVVENNSEEEITFKYYDKIKNSKNIKVVKYEGGFNYSKINNFAVQYASGEYLLFLNNDVEVITEDFIEEMLMFAQRKDIGAVGGKLYYRDDTIQHAGIIVGLGGAAAHSHRNFDRSNNGYLWRLIVANNVSAVTGACLMMRKNVFDEVCGFNEDLAVAYNDVDLCLKIRDKGYLIVCTPDAELYHYESKSRGFEDTKQKMKRFRTEKRILRDRWRQVIRRDPYYNVNLTLDREDFSLK